MKHSMASQSSLLHKITILMLSAFLLASTVTFAEAQWLYNADDIYYNNGNVGIGTTNPTAKLHVSGGSMQLGGGTFEFLDNTGHYCPTV